MKGIFGHSLATLLLATAAPVLAQEAAGPAAPAPVTLGTPTFYSIIGNNPNPTSFTLGPLGKVYVTGFASGLGSTQSNAVPGDDSSFADIANAHVYIQNTEGLFQFLVQAGYYSFPSLGLPYVRSATNTDNSFGPVPMAWGKIAPSANFNIQFGILPTLIGAEAAYTYQNMNIDRGLLWGQENIFNRGVQANAVFGKLTLALSLNDGFYSGRYNWVTGSAAYAINSSNTIAFVAGGATSKEYKSTYATPLFLNNSSIYNVIYTYTNGPVMIQPYFQYTHVPHLTFGSGGTSFTTDSVDTWGVALLARYSVADNFAVPVRFEYIELTGKGSATAPNLLYGPGSNAFSFTVTPTFTIDRFFVRAELNVVQAGSITSGSAFGTYGEDKSQVRGLLELGVAF